MTLFTFFVGFLQMRGGNDAHGDIGGEQSMLQAGGGYALRGAHPGRHRLQG